MISWLYSTTPVVRDTYQLAYTSTESEGGGYQENNTFGNLTFALGATLTSSASTSAFTIIDSNNFTNGISERSFIYSNIHTASSGYRNYDDSGNLIGSGSGVGGSTTFASSIQRMEVFSSGGFTRSASTSDHTIGTGTGVDWISGGSDTTNGDPVGSSSIYTDSGMDSYPVNTSSYTLQDTTISSGTGQYLTTTNRSTTYAFRTWGSTQKFGTRTETYSSFRTTTIVVGSKTSNTYTTVTFNNTFFSTSSTNTIVQTTSSKSSSTIITTSGATGTFTQPFEWVTAYKLSSNEWGVIGNTNTAFTIGQITDLAHTFTDSTTVIPYRKFVPELTLTLNTAFSGSTGAVSVVRQTSTIPSSISSTTFYDLTIGRSTNTVLFQEWVPPYTTTQDQQGNVSLISTEVTDTVDPYVQVFITTATITFTTPKTTTIAFFSSAVDYSYSFPVATQIGYTSSTSTITLNGNLVDTGRSFSFVSSSTNTGIAAAATTFNTGFTLISSREVPITGTVETSYGGLAALWQRSFRPDGAVEAPGTMFSNYQAHTNLDPDLLDNFHIIANEGWPMRADGVGVPLFTNGSYIKNHNGRPGDDNYFDDSNFVDPSLYTTVEWVHSFNTLSITSKSILPGGPPKSLASSTTSAILTGAGSQSRADGQEQLTNSFFPCMAFGGSQKVSSGATIMSLFYAGQVTTYDTDGNSGSFLTLVTAPGYAALPDTSPLSGIEAIPLLQAIPGGSNPVVSIYPRNKNLTL